MGRGDVVDLWRALIVVDEQVKLYCGSERGLAVLAPHNPEHFAVLPLPLDIDEAENDRQNCALEKLKLEGLSELAGWKSAEALDEAHVLLRVFLAVVVRIQRIVVVQVAKDDGGDLLHLRARGYRSVEDAAEVLAYRLLARASGLLPSHRTSSRSGNP